MSANVTAPSPNLFFDTLNAFQRTEAIKAAVDLRVFSAIGKESASAAEIAQRCDSSERGIRVLCDYLTMMGFLTKEDNRYALTQDSALFLDRQSPAYLGGVMDFLLSDDVIGAFKNMASCVRKGGTLLGGEGSVVPENPMWVTFARSMAPLMGPAAEFMADLVGGNANQTLRVLDVAAGHGMFGIAIGKRFPRAEIVALDWSNVLQVAEENATRAQLDGRYNLQPGSAFDLDWGTGFDIVLLTNFLHHFDHSQCEALLRRAHAALKPDGRLFTLEFVPDEDRVSPPRAAAFSLTMLATTLAGDAYTFSELETMLRNAGFSHNELKPLPVGIEQLVISRK